MILEPRTPKATQLGHGCGVLRARRETRACRVIHHHGRRQIFGTVLPFRSERAGLSVFPCLMWVEKWD